MKVYLYVWRGERGMGHYPRGDEGQAFTKEIGWTTPPPLRDTIMVGTDEDGENASINAHVDEVYWISDGSIQIAAHMANVEATDGLDGYHSIIESIRRDGWEPV